MMGVFLNPELELNLKILVISDQKKRFWASGRGVDKRHPKTPRRTKGRDRYSYRQLIKLRQINKLERNQLK